jgi:hypothetical protein
MRVSLVRLPLRQQFFQNLNGSADPQHRIAKVAFSRARGSRGASSLSVDQIAVVLELIRHG